MLRLSVVAAVAALLTLCQPLFAEPQPLATGAAAPKADLVVKDTAGKEWTLKSAAKDKGLLVIFTCNTCPFVVKWDDRLVAATKLAQEKGIGVLLLNSNEATRDTVDSVAAMAAHATAKAYTAPYAVDSKSALADAFGAAHTPDVFLFDKDLKLAYHGAIDDNVEVAAAVKHPYLTAAVTAVAEGKAVDPAATKAVGCSIKRLN